MNSTSHRMRLFGTFFLALSMHYVSTTAQDDIAVAVEEQAAVAVDVAFDEFADMDPNGRGIGDLVFQKLTVTKGIILRAATLDEKQHEEIKKRDKAWLVSFMKERNKRKPAQQARGVGGLLGFLGGQPQAIVDVQNQNPAVAASMVEEDAKRELLKILTDEQRTKVEEEFRKQDEFRAKGQAMQIVGLLTDKLMLEETERDKLMPGLTEWSKTNELYMEIYNSNPNMVPQLPAKLMRESLSLESRELYKSFQAYNYTSENVWGMETDDGELVFQELP